MRSRAAVVETLRPPTVRAPELARVVDALLAYAQDPTNRRAKIAVALLEKQGALDCPACGAVFDVSGYRATHTAFSTKRCLSCMSCRTSYVVEESEMA